MDNCCCGRPIALRGPRKAVRGKCERGQGSANVGAEVQTWTGRVRKAMRAMGARRGRLSAPWPRFHGVDRADVYIIIHVRACCCGECELNPPPSPPIPRRRSSLTPPAQRHDLAEHFRSPTQSRRTPADCAMHARRPHNPLPAEDLPSPPHSDTPSPNTSAPPRNPDARPRSPEPRPQAARCTPAALTTHSPLRHAASPSVPLRAQKNGTAQRVCDAECFGRPSLRSVIWVGEPRAVRRRCGALACRRGA